VGDSDAPGVTGGVLHVRYWSYDSQTGQMRVVATAHALGTLQEYAVDHGSLAIGIESPQGNASTLDLIDLGTGAIRMLKTSTTAHESFFAVDFSWPYMIYDDALLTDPPSGTLNAINLQSNAQFTLPSRISGSLTITGDTLFADDTHTTASGTAEIDEIDHFGTPGSPIISLFTYPGDDGISAADARLIVFGDGNFPLAWDRVEHHLVLLASPGDLYQDEGISNPVQMSGDFLMITTKSGDHEQVTIYNTTSLPAQ
jgi:hypothetical protein